MSNKKNSCCFSFFFFLFDLSFDEVIKLIFILFTLSDNGIFLFLFSELDFVFISEFSDKSLILLVSAIIFNNALSGVLDNSSIFLIFFVLFSLSINEIVFMLFSFWLSLVTLFILIFRFSFNILVDVIFVFFNLI